MRTHLKDMLAEIVIVLVVIGYVAIVGSVLKDVSKGRPAIERILITNNQGGAR
jgi:hypothetical protein